MIVIGPDWTIVQESEWMLKSPADHIWLHMNDIEQNGIIVNKAALSALIMHEWKWTRPD
jgi:hypothetical protein